jgi:hypothetical protein
MMYGDNGVVLKFVHVSHYYICQSEHRGRTVRGVYCLGPILAIVGSEPSWARTYVHIVLSRLLHKGLTMNRPPTQGFIPKCIQKFISLDVNAKLICRR